MHSALVLWMVQLLLTSTHTLQGSVDGEGETGERENQRREHGGSEDKQEESKGEEGAEETEVEEEEEGEVGVREKHFEEGMGLTAVLSVDLREEYQSLSDSLKRFTTALTR